MPPNNVAALFFKLLRQTEIWSGPPPPSGGGGGKTGRLTLQPLIILEKDVDWFQRKWKAAAAAVNAFSIIAPTQESSCCRNLTWVRSCMDSTGKNNEM
jgi:hypothetical protein